MILFLIKEYKYFGRYWYFLFLKYMFDNDFDNIFNEFINICSFIVM